MLDRYIVKNGKKMRYGYTTGSTAAAAAKAAAIMALKGEPLDSIEIDTPKGWSLKLEVKDYEINDGMATCWITKDGGDDPDNTHGILIGASVEIKNGADIVLKGGKGVGTVTKPGLQVPPGEPAINPVPQKMIRKEVSDVLPNGKGATVTIFVPEGEEIAKKTFNPRLGIVNGISILGTSGIVEPMSEEAFKDSLALELKVAVQGGLDKIILVPGNHGRDIALEQYGFKKDQIFKTSNFIGFMLEKCIEYKIKKVLMIGHIGKFVKLAGGIFHTHSKVADARVEILSSNLALLGAPQALIQSIFDCVTTEAALTLIEEAGYQEVYDKISEKAEEKSKEYIYHQMDIGVVLFSLDKRILSIGPKGKMMLEDFKNA
ncbi:MAG: cobalt-precorrin-5B (C(1))-methyltransferase CbiD [Thermotaleaceae bacterium]